MNPTQELNRQRNLAVDRGENPYAGNLASYSSFSGAGLPTTITSESLTSQTPFNLSPQTTGTSATGLGEEMTSRSSADVATADANDALVRQTNKEYLDRQAGEKKSAGFLSDFLGTRKGEIALTDEAYTGGVDTDSADLKEINNRILAVDNRYRKEIEALQNNPQGKYRENLQADINTLQRQASSEKADLYIEQLAKQGKYDSAKQIADRKVAMLLENDRITLDKLQFDYENNKELFTKAEQRQFELAQADRNRALDSKRETAKLFETTKIDLMKSANEQNAPQSVKDAINRSKTIDEAINAAGQYGGDIQARLIKDAQLRNLNSEINKRNAETKALEVPTITNADAGQYAGAISTILGSNKFTAVQKRDFVNAVNSGQDPFQVIKNQARNLLGTEKTDLLKFEAAKSSMESLDSELKAFYAAGGKSNIFSGNFEKVNNKLGAVNDPNLVNIAVQIAASLQRYRNAISGTAYSEQEGKDIASIFPGITKGELLNSTIVKARLTTLNSDIDGMYESVLGNTYNDLKKANTQPSANTTTTVKSNGQDYIVGQVYNDGTSNWTVDAQGKWTKQ